MPSSSPYFSLQLVKHPWLSKGSSAHHTSSPERPHSCASEGGWTEQREQAAWAEQRRWGCTPQLGTLHEVRLPKPMVTRRQRQEDTDPDTDLKVTWVSAMTYSLLSLSSPSFVSGPATPWTAAHRAPVSFTAPPHQGPQQRMLKPQAENHSSWGVAPRTPTSSTEVPAATGRRPATLQLPHALPEAMARTEQLGNPRRMETPATQLIPAPTLPTRAQRLTQATPIMGVGAHSIPTPPQQQCPWQQGPRTPETHGATASRGGWKHWVSSAVRGHAGKRPPKLELQRHLLENQGKRPLIINLPNSESKQKKLYWNEKGVYYFKCYQQKRNSSTFTHKKIKNMIALYHSDKNDNSSEIKLKEFSNLIYCCCYSIPQSCLTLCDPMDYSAPGSSVLHYLLEFVHWVSNDT